MLWRRRRSDGRLNVERDNRDGGSLVLAFAENLAHQLNIEVSKACLSRLILFV